MRTPGALMHVVMIMQLLLFMDSYCAPEMFIFCTFNPHNNAAGLVLLPHFTQEL